MSRLPKIALVGRPNVGKSALFNRICNRRISIVDEAEGVTRDRIYAKTEFFGHTIEMIDTGGITTNDERDFQEAIRRQAEIAIEEADHLIMVVDSRVGPTHWDERLAKWLLAKGKRVSLAVNKVDSSDSNAVYPFARLGISPMTAVSATQGFQIAELLEEALRDLSIPETDPEADRIKVAIMGRANVGKSTLMNALLSSERCIVSPIPGTTRDSIDVKVTIEGHDYLLIDTAGIRRKKAEKEAVDKFAAVRSSEAMERADVCLLVMDSEEGMTTQEKRIATELAESGKGCVLLFNKWDLVKGFRQEHCLKAIRQEASFLNHCPAVFISAKTGKNLSEIFRYVYHVHREQNKRITTGKLNKFVESAIQRCHPPMLGGKRLRIYYMAQVATSPPHFVLFVNKEELMTEFYKKYLMNQFRSEYQFAGVPLKFSLREKEKRI